MGPVVSSLVKNVLTPLLAIPGTVNFADLQAQVGGADIPYGLFLSDLISFLTIAAGVFFFVVRPVNALMGRRRTEPDVESTTTDCPHCLSSIPLGASAWAFYTRDAAA